MTRQTSLATYKQKMKSFIKTFFIDALMLINIAIHNLPL